MTNVRKTTRGRDNQLPLRRESRDQQRGILSRIAWNGGLERFLAALTLFAIAFFGSAQQARAYADPGSGALIWQMLAAGFVGVLFYLRKFASWLKPGSEGSSAEESLSQNQVQAELSSPEK
jgi:hypothetical protein